MAQNSDTTKKHINFENNSFKKRLIYKEKVIEMKNLYQKPELDIIKISSQILTATKSGEFDLDDEDSFL